MDNPFILQADADGYLEAGDRWAKLALHCADRARECWRLAGLAQADCERSMRELGALIVAERSSKP